MVTRTLNTSLMSRESLEQLAQTQLARIPVVQISLWPNTKRRDDKNDAQFTGRVGINRVLLLEQMRADLSEAGNTSLDQVLADLVANGAIGSELYADVWHNAPAVGKSGGDKPILSGRCRNFVGALPVADTAQSDALTAALKIAAAS